MRHAGDGICTYNLISYTRAMFKIEWFADGSFFSEDPKLVVRAKLKKDNEKLKTHEREPVNPMPRGFVPG